MANEELKETISLTEYLNVLEKEDEQTKKRGNRTIEHRRNLIEEANQHSKDNVELERIRKSLIAEAEKYAKSGNKILSKRYQDAAAVVTQQIKDNKLADKRNQKEKKKQELIKKYQKSLTGAAKSLLTMTGITGGLLFAFKEFAKLTGTIGKEFGAIGMQSDKFKTDMLASHVEATKLGQSLTEVVGVSKDLTDNFGFSRQEASDMTVEILNTSMALGLSNEQGTKLIGTLMQVSGMSFDTAQNFAKQTALLAEAEGVAPQTVMRDIAQSSETIAKFTAMTPEHLAKAAIQATKLGTTLDTIAGSMESMLDFQTSLNNQIEAEIMLGRSVNLQKARELALAGKADEFAVEMTKQLGSQAEFEKMNVLQRQSLAKALGVSVEQMSKMITNQDKVRTIGQAISEQPGLEEMIGEKAMDAMAQTIANLKAVGAQLITDIGPAVANAAQSFANIVKYLSESKAVIPVITSLMGLMLGKSVLNFVFTAATALGKSFGSLGPLGIAGILSIPVILGGLVGTLMQLRTGTEIGGVAEGTVAQLHAGETVLNRRDSQTLASMVGMGGITVDDLKRIFSDSMKPMIEGQKRQGEQNEKLITATLKNASATADAIEDKA